MPATLDVIEAALIGSCIRAAATLLAEPDALPQADDVDEMARRLYKRATATPYLRGDAPPPKPRIDNQTEPQTVVGPEPIVVPTVGDGV